MRLSYLASALLPLTTILAADLSLLIPATPLLPNPSTLPPTTHATLQSLGVPVHAPITRRNTFEFHNITQGSYLLNVHCRDYAFEGLRVDVDMEDVMDGEKRERIRVWQTFRGNEWSNLGEKRGEGSKEAIVEARVVRGMDYYQVRSGFSPMSLFKNPMILMALFSVLMIYGMPKLMDNMDPETKAEFEEMKKGGVMGGGDSNPASQLQNFDMASWLSGAKSSGSGGGGSGEETKSGGGGSAKKR